MNNRRNPAAPLIRCAIYTRKSTEEGLDQDFNSLDAQRESSEAYVKSQAHEGWTCLPDRYDDGGFTGGNMDRPALQRLMDDIAAGRIDIVVCYKVDRLSRSLLDFARMMEVFDRHSVSFAAVTQQFNTATSMGRLVLNVLLSFAQFEREIISERTRDKIAAARRKGKWSGGLPPLGYNVDAATRKLVINEEEAGRVCEIFDLYLRNGALLPVVQELSECGWRTKRWVTRKGNVKGSRPFTKTDLYELLTNVAYLGKVRYKDEIHPGEHSAIVAVDIWEAVQARLRENGKSGRPTDRLRSGAILAGLLRCKPCGCAMTPAHATKENKRYRYYTCTGAQKRGRKTCASGSVPAAEIERFVFDEVMSASGRSAPDSPAGPYDVQNIVERVEYDGATHTLTIQLRGGCAEGDRDQSRVVVEREIHFRSAGRGGRKVLRGGPEETPAPALTPAPRIARLMALAMRLDGVVRDGTVADYAELDGHFASPGAVGFLVTKGLAAPKARFCCSGTYETAI